MEFFTIMAIGMILAVVGFFLLFSATMGILLVVAAVTPFVGLILFAIGVYILVNGKKNKKEKIKDSRSCPF